MDDRQKVDIERAIERARDGVSERIDELDRRLRTSLDVKTIAGEHVPKIMAGGAVVGFLVGFGLPKLLRRIVGIGLPLALVAMKIQSARNGQSEGHSGIGPVDD
ncbi:MAG TPA: hypothetical protein VMS98_19090 [Thermoanaerobaculia bacterium]|nr:hypothetical protein [Thermoanaerobaculia bacterium]